MRKIKLAPLASKQWIKWSEACKKATEECIKVIDKGNRPVFKKTLYRSKKMKNEFFFCKDTPFYGKCAYCETYIPDFQHGDIEHFRPKGAVADEEDRPIYQKDQNGNILNDANGNPLPHLGYYWLAYDWQNLLPSCTVCNQPVIVDGRKIGKHNRFPVIGIHAQKPDEVANEKPLIINPASNDPDDDPALHIEFNVDPDNGFGLLIPKTERGMMCIEIFGLNIRDQLVSDRKRAYWEVLALLTRMINNPAKRAEALAELHAIREGQRSYTIAGRAALDELYPDLSKLFEKKNDVANKI